MIKDFNKKSDKDKIAFLMSQFEHMRTSRSYYENIWNDVDRLVLGVDFSYDSKPLEKKRFIDVYDGSIMKGVRTAASAYAGLIWKKFGNSIKVRPDEIEETQEVKTWFDKVNRDFAAELDDASKNFDGVLGRCITDGILKSTMAPGVHLDENGEIFFKHHASRFLYFKDNAKEIADFLAIRMWKPVTQIIEEYGIDNVGESIAKKYQDKYQMNVDIEVIQFIMPNPDKRLAEEKPYLSIHVATAEKQILKDSFLDYLPIKVARFYKDEWAAYGTSPCMDSIMTIKRNNAITGEVFETAELQNKPAMSMFVDQVAGDGDISIAPGSVNQFNSNTSGGAPMSVLWAGGNPQQAWAIRQDLKNELAESLNLDVLLDFNNQTQMTATEVNIRDNIRSSVLNIPLSNMITNMLNPLINETFNIKFNKGDFGFIEGSQAWEIEREKAALKGIEFSPELIPDDIVKAIQDGKSVYKIDYLTAAARLLQSQDIQTAFSMIEFTGAMEQLAPGSLDNLDTNKMYRNTLNSAGMNEELRSKEEVVKIQEARAEMAAQERAAAAQQQQAQVENTQASTEQIQQGV